MTQNDPALVAKALAKAQSVEARLNALIGTAQNPQQPSIIYGKATTVVTQSANGVYTWTCPAGVTSAMIECWGAGAGGGGGNSSRGGPGGGGGEYTQEPSYPVVPGVVYSYLVGAGGTGGTTNNAGNSGSLSYFDLSTSGNGVFATGGTAVGGNVGGAGGSGSVQTIESTGGNGGGNGAQGNGGCGGGGSGGSTGNGGSGTSSLGGGSTLGTAGGAAGTGGGAAGGAGGNQAVSGSNGVSPGGGGGGCGDATATGQVSFGYNPTSSITYYGADAAGGNANGQRASITGNLMYQGGETASGGTYNGTMKSMMILPSSIVSDLSGVTIDSCKLYLHNLNSWYNNGMTVVLSYTANTSLPATWTGSGATSVSTWACPEAADHVQSLTSGGLPAALKSGAARALALYQAPAYDLGYYGYFTGAGGGSLQPELFITGHTGAAPVKGGNGADGRVQITYTSTSALVAAVQPAATTDDTGNAVAAGYTGTTTAIQPNSNPAIVETWHTAALSGSWTAVQAFEYALMPDNTVQVSAELTVPSTIVASSVLTTLSSGYWPARTEHILGLENAGTPFTGIVHVVEVSTSGVVTVFGTVTSANTLRVFGRYPLGTT